MVQQNHPKEAVSDNSFCKIFEFDDHCASKVCLKNDFRYLCLCQRDKAEKAGLTCPDIIKD